MCIWAVTLKMTNHPFYQILKMLYWIKIWWQWRPLEYSEPSVIFRKQLGDYSRFVKQYTGRLWHVNNAQVVLRGIICAKNHCYKAGWIHISGSVFYSAFIQFYFLKSVFSLVICWLGSLLFPTSVFKPRPCSLSLQIVLVTFVCKLSFVTHLIASCVWPAFALLTLNFAYSLSAYFLKIIAWILTFAAFQIKVFVLWTLCLRQTLFVQVSHK